MAGEAVLGAAMPAAALERHHNWLKAAARDVEIQDFFEPGIFEADWQARADLAQRWLDGHEGRIGLHGPFYDLPLGAVDPAVRDLVKRRMDQGLDACAATGATMMVVHSPYTTWDWYNIDHFDGRADLIARVKATLADAVARAEATGVTLVIENIEDKDPAARVELARVFASPAVQVSIDTGHAHYAHGATGAPPVDYYVLAAGGMLAHMHLQDADGVADRHWAPGQGSIHWHAVFAALERTGARPRLILELADHGALPAAAEWMAARLPVR